MFSKIFKKYGKKNNLREYFDKLLIHQPFANELGNKNRILEHDTVPTFSSKIFFVTHKVRIQESHNVRFR